MTDQQLSHLAVLTSLNKMMRASHFNICALDEAIKTLGSIPDKRAYGILRPLHCVDWGDMPAELRAAVPALIERCVSVPAYQFQLTDLTQKQQETLQSNTLRLLVSGGDKP